MSRTASVSRFCLISILVSGIAIGTALAAKEPSTVIVAPARPRVIQLVQDMFRLRSIGVVSYQGAVTATDPVLHKWDGKAWKRITVEDYQATLPERVVLIGDQKSLPAVLAEGASRSEDTRGIQTFDVTTIIRELSKLFDLSTAEMSDLAKRNGVAVVDKNENLRRYGKYYPGPGYDELHGGKSTEAEPVEKTDVPPEPDLPAIKIEPASQEKPAPVDADTKAPVVVTPVPEKSKKVEISPDDK